MRRFCDRNPNLVLLKRTPCFNDTNNPIGDRQHYIQVCHLKKKKTYKIKYFIYFNQKIHYKYTQLVLL